MNRSAIVGEDETLDVLCNEKLLIIQKKTGYRFSIDAILISNFVQLRKNDRVLDIGSGCGIIPIYLSKKGFNNPFLGVEIQEELFFLCERNKNLNSCENIQFIHGDIRVLKDELKEKPFEVIISNPPYTKEASGRRSPKKSRLVARYESTLKLSEIIELGRSLLAFLGRLYLIYPTQRICELIYYAKTSNLEPKRLRFVHSRKNEKATLVLVELRKGAKSGLIVENPLYIYDNSGYTEEVRSYYEL